MHLVKQMPKAIEVGRPVPPIKYEAPSEEDHRDLRGQKVPVADREQGVSAKKSVEQKSRTRKNYVVHQIENRRAPMPARCIGKFTPGLHPLKNGDHGAEDDENR